MSITYQSSNFGIFSLLINSSNEFILVHLPFWFKKYLLYHADKNKAGYTATEVACGWAGAKFEVTRPFGQER